VQRVRKPFAGKRGVAIVGPGRVGQAMGKLLRRAGVPVLFVVARRMAAAKKAVRFIGAGRPLAWSDPRFTEAPIVLLTTTDTALQLVAQSLSRMVNDWSGKMVLHTCGSLPASVLSPLKRKGAAIGSIHPFQTIPNPAAGVRSLVGCYWGIEGEPPARQVAEQWVKLLRGVAFPVRAARKDLYHLAAFLTCPTAVTLMERAAGLLKEVGIPARIARPMLAQFVAQAARNFGEIGGRRALTGPVVRRDWTTIQKHLAALRRSFPDLIPVYIALLRPMLRLAGLAGNRELQTVLRA
jgi:predicted short-subunit dehydrogenase-like oxidoreductase (DUF2520 family)